MDFNYTLRYRTFDELLNEVLVDLRTYNLENLIEPHILIKTVLKVNYDLGLRITQTKEALLEINHNKARLPEDFYTMNFASLCGEYEVHNSLPQGTNTQEVPYTDFPQHENICGSSCDNPENNLYGNPCQQPRVFTNCKGENYELIQVINPSTVRVYKYSTPLKFTSSQSIECNCPNLYVNSSNTAYLKNGFLFTNFNNGNVYLNYQGSLEDKEGNILVPDHPLLNEYYEYALKSKILEDLYMNGEDVSNKIQLVEQKLRMARNNALSLVNTPNFKELENLWKANRKAMNHKYIDMFKTYPGWNQYPYNI